MASDTNVCGSDSENAPTTPLPSSSRFTPPDPATLARLFPQLEVLELIGAGGMGAVYKARQPGLDRLVAIKILPPEVGADPAFAQRFTREAQALARLGHQHIVSVYDFGVAEGLYYFIMEYVDGANLRHLIKSGELKPAEALAIVPQICEALQFAHDEGVVHRDIKPENILIDKRGRVKIADFGLARLLGKSAPELSLTGTNQVLGTLHYMAPEQIQGLRTVDHRADIYSLGVVFYEMLTGELPLGRFAPPSQRVAVDVRLDEVVLRSLESQPERRYQKASQVKTDVEQISIAGIPASAQRFVNSAQASDSNVILANSEASVAAERSIKKLSNWLLVVGGLGLVFVFLVPLWLAFDGAERLFETKPTPYHSGRSVYLIAAALSLWYAMVAVPHALLIIVAALLLRNLRGYRLAIAACVLAALPIALVVPIGLPIGLWGLAVLTSQNVRSVFAREAAKDARTASQRLFWPAVGLLAAAAVDAAQAFVLFGGGIESLLMRGGNEFVELCSIGGVAFVMFLTRVIGGIRMLRLRSLRVCLAASAVSLLPVSFGSVVGIPIGIWALLELMRPDVKKAFVHADDRDVDTHAPVLEPGVEPKPGISAPAPMQGMNVAIASSDAADEQQRAAELAERPPAWLAFVELALFGLGWLFVGAMWNFGTVGLWFGFAVLATITYLAVRWNLVYLPKLQRELQRQSRLRRGFALVAGLTIFVFAMMFVSGAQISFWDTFGNPSSFVQHKVHQDQLFAALKSAKLGELPETAFNVKSIGPITYRSPWEPIYLAVAGFFLVAAAVATMVDTRRYRNSWKHCWGTALGVAVLLFTMLVVIVPIFMPKGAGRLPTREIRSAATTDKLKEVVQAWGSKNGYKVDVQASGFGGSGGVRQLRLEPVEKLKPEDFGPGFAGLDGASASKDGKQYVIKDGKVWEQVSENYQDKLEVVRFRLVVPSALDRYRTSWHRTYRPQPPLTVTCVMKTSTRRERVHQKSSPETKTVETVAQIDTGWEWLGTPELRLWTPLLDELESKLRDASQTATQAARAKP